MKREDYSEGYTIIVADLTPFEIGGNFDLKAEGTLSVDLVFKSPLAATIPGVDLAFLLTGISGVGYFRTTQKILCH